MKTPLILSAAAGAAMAQQSGYGQCGGEGWTGPTACAAGFSCKDWNPYYYQCIPTWEYSALATTTSSSAACTSAPATIPTIFSSSVKAVPTSSAVTSALAVQSTFITSVRSSLSSTAPKASSAPALQSTLVISVKQASTFLSVATVAASSSPIPSASVSSTHVSSAPVSSVAKSSAVVSPTISATSAAAATVSSASTSSTNGKVKYGGINISGFDFGCSTDGTCTVSGVVNPGSAGISQMKHFVTDDGLNAFRLPVGWQYLTNSVVGGTLDSTNFAAYDALVQGCITAGAALCIIDIHNYARWNGGIIGQGGPTNDEFAALWTSLAKKYASTPKVAFGIMNEPQSVAISTWADTVQAAVTAIRTAGATDNIILLPGNDWTHASTLISDGSAAALLKVTNPDGSTTNLVFDVHQYLDSDGSGTSTECTTNNIATAFSPLATWLRANKRQAFLSETGGGSTSSCETYLCQQLAYVNENADVFLGFTTWGAGMFSSGYALLETPTLSGSTWTDQAIVAQCVVPNFKS